MTNQFPDRTARAPQAFRRAHGFVPNDMLRTRFALLTLAAPTLASLMLFFAFHSLCWSDPVMDAVHALLQQFGAWASPVLYGLAMVCGLFIGLVGFRLGRWCNVGIARFVLRWPKERVVAAFDRGEWPQSWLAPKAPERVWRSIPVRAFRALGAGLGYLALMSAINWVIGMQFDETSVQALLPSWHNALIFFAAGALLMWLYDSAAKGHGPNSGN